MRIVARERTLILQKMLLEPDSFLRDDYRLIFHRYGHQFSVS